MAEAIVDLPSFAARLESLINCSDVKQIDIAKALGYERPNIIMMFQQGKIRVPVEKISMLARTLAVDPNAMLRHYLSEYEPAMLCIIEHHFGALITRNEQLIIDEIRCLSNGRDPAINTTSGRIALEGFVTTVCR